MAPAERFSDAAADRSGFVWYAQARRGAPCSVPARPPSICVVPDTGSYRALAGRVAATDHVVEVGSCLGQCTEILQQRAASVVGFDVSESFLASCRARLPGIRFEFLDVFEEAERLAAMPEASACSVAFLDIGGDRQLQQVVRAIEVLRARCLPALRQLVVKSEELHAAALVWIGCGDGVPEEAWHVVSQPDGFLQSLGSQSAGDAPKPYALRSQKRKAARCARILAEAACHADPSPMLTRRAVEAALPPRSLGLSGSGFRRLSFHCAIADGVLEASCAAVTTEANQPLLRERDVACVYGGEAAARDLAAATRHPVPVFVGPGAAGAPVELLGAYRVGALMAPDSPLYEDAGYVRMVEALAARSRRRAPAVLLLRLERVDAADLSLWPCSADAAGQPSGLAAATFRAAFVALFFDLWRSGAR